MNLRSLSAALSLAMTVAAAQAGGMGGPPPFRNGSPLLTGIDGRYQAVASAPNVSGIINFAIQNGVQTSIDNQNSWMFFIDGNILNGVTTANISGGKVNGILSSGVSSIPTDADGQVTLPMSFLIPGNAAAGHFYGKVDLNSPVSAMSGDGMLVGTPARTDQILLVTGGTDTSFTGVIDGNFISITGATYIPVFVPASTQGEVEWKFRGSRLSTAITTTSSGSSSGSSN